MRNSLTRLLRDDEGQDLVEYVLLVSLIALAVAAAFPPVTDAITAVFTRVRTSLGGGGTATVRRSRAGEVCGANVVAADRA